MEAPSHSDARDKRDSESTGRPSPQAAEPCNGSGSSQEEAAAAAPRESADPEACSAAAPADSGIPGIATAAAQPAVAQPATASEAPTPAGSAAQHSAASGAGGEPRGTDAAEPGVGAAAEPLKSCNLCCAQYPRSEFKVLSGGRRASYCVKCTGYVCQGRTRRLSIHDLRRAMKNSELDTLLRGDSPLPADHKRCQLCAEVLELANFRPLPRGGHESYCGTCSKYVRRGTKLGLNIEGVRKAREDGTLDNLVKDVASACKPGHKRCNLCSEEKAVDDFSTTSKGRSSYCTSCERLVRRGHNKGLQMETMRTAFKDGTIHALLPPPATSARPDRKSLTVPDGHKACNLCEQILLEAEFKLKYDGSLGSYCSTCDKLVGRGRRRGLTMDAMRTGFKDGSLQGLLESQPVTGSVTAGPAEPRGGGGAGSKGCNLCSQELPLSRFRVTAGARVGAYCMECDKLIGRGRRRGLTIDALRACMVQGRLQETLGLPREGSRSGEGSGASERPAYSVSLDGGPVAGLPANGAGGTSAQAPFIPGVPGPVVAAAARSDAVSHQSGHQDVGEPHSYQHGASSIAASTLAAMAAHSMVGHAALSAGAVEGAAIHLEGGEQASRVSLKRNPDGTQPGGDRTRPKVSAQSADPERTDSETLSD